MRGADPKFPEFAKLMPTTLLLSICGINSKSHAFLISDEVYQLAADMGGAGYTFTGENDADVMYNSMQINLNVLRVPVKEISKYFLFFLCVYLS